MVKAVRIKVQYSDQQLEYGKLRRPYCLTLEGKKEAEDLLPLNIIRSWSNEKLSQFIVNYKLLAILNIIEYFGQKALSKKLIDISNLHRLLSLERIDEGEKTSTAIDNDLRAQGFTHDEIINLWLMYNGESIKSILERFGGNHFFERFPFKLEVSNLTEKQKEEEMKSIRESLLLYRIEQIIKQGNKMIDLTPFESILDIISEDEVGGEKILDEKLSDELMKESLEKERRKLFP